MIAGADTYEQIENFGKKRKKWLTRFLELLHGIPSHKTLYADTALFFKKMETRIRKGSAPENFAAIRHIALNLLRNNKTFKGSVKSKRLNAAMDTDYLENIVFR